jgi:hypothetical protein
MIVGKDFMEEVPHEVNFSTNILQLPNSHIKGLDYNDRIKQIPVFKENGLIRESQSPFAAPLLFVPKSPLPDGSIDLRMIIDYKALNEIIIKGRFPLPSPEELIEKIQGKKFFSKLDLMLDITKDRLPGRY